MGYSDGYTSNLNNVTIEYIYHKHVDGNGNASSTTKYSTTNPGGCYVAAGHTHNATGTCATETYTYEETQGHAWTTLSDGQAQQCTRCGYINSAGGSPYMKCPVKAIKTGTRYACGSYTNTWVIGCGKSTSTIETATIKYS